MQNVSAKRKARSITLTVHLFYIELLIVDVWLIIDVKTFCYVFYILVTFLRFLTFLYLSNVFYFKQRWQSSDFLIKQINKKHFQNNSNEIDL